MTPKSYSLTRFRRILKFPSTYVFCNVINISTSTYSVFQTSTMMISLLQRQIFNKMSKCEKKPSFSPRQTAENVIFLKFRDFQVVVTSKVLGVRSWDRNMFYTYIRRFFGEKGRAQYVHPNGTDSDEK